MHLNSLSIMDDAEEDDDYEKKAPPTSSASLPVASTIALCMCTLTHSYLLISVFPYSGFMAIELLPSVDEENAGSYAGFIASSFMLGRSLTSYAWGKIADSYGRTTVLYISLLLSGLFTLLFGTSRTFTCAIVFRGLLGVSNGIIGTAKTVVSELSQDNERKETKMIGLVMG